MNKIFDFFGIKRIWLKFATTVILAVLLTMSFTSYLRLLNDYNTIPQRIGEKLETTVEVASLAVSDPLWNYNLEGIISIGDSIFTDKEVHSVRITDLRRGEIYSRDNEHDDSFEGEKHYRIMNKIYQDEVYIGDIEISMTDYFLLSDARAIFSERLNDMLIQVFILIIFISLISVTITNPLKKLEEGAIDLAEGHYTKKN